MEVTRYFLFVLLALALTMPLAAQERAHIVMDASEADLVLAIVAKHAAGEPVTEADWQKLFATEPYVRLKKRETGLRREFTDDDFKSFVLSADVARNAAELRSTLEAWGNADLQAAAQRALAYLPPQARIRAKVYPVIKPRTNTFVFEVATDPAVFLSLDPKVSPAELENTVAHEFHHIGYSSLGHAYDKEVVQKAPENVSPVLNWMGAFGEGLAVLAAAGSPDVHPMAVFKEEEHSQWDRDMNEFNGNLRQVEQFFLDVLQGRLKDEQAINQAAFQFFGQRGPWYTVGYRMGALIEKRYGRQTLLDCMRDPRQLLARYNQAAAEENKRSKEKQALWSPELLKAIGVAK